MILRVDTLQWTVFWTGRRKCVDRNKNLLSHLICLKEGIDSKGFYYPTLQVFNIWLYWMLQVRMRTLGLLDSVCSRAVYSWTSNSHSQTLSNFFVVSTTTSTRSSITLQRGIANMCNFHGPYMGDSILVMMHVQSTMLL